MAIEVEQKHPVPNLAAVESRLGALGARHVGTVAQADRYFNHPARDFATSDEALRIRQVGCEAVVTYKGPRLVPGTKTRREIELPLAGDSGEWRDLLGLLGFRETLVVEKVRREYEVDRAGRTVQVACDTVTGLGEFVELELVVPGMDEVPAAQQVVAELAAELGLGACEVRSYLELLLTKSAGGNQ